jgi:dihydrofolate reductase
MQRPAPPVSDPPTARKRIALVLVVAVADNGVIGQGGRLPWRTEIGAGAFSQSNDGQADRDGGARPISRSAGPLPGRTNIVVSREPTFARPGIVAAPASRRR